LLEDAEAYGVLAAGADPDALGATEETMGRLEALNDKLSDELAERGGLSGRWRWLWGNAVGKNRS
jgi:hypothetical protein